MCLSEVGSLQVKSVPIFVRTIWKLRDTSETWRNTAFDECSVCTVPDLWEIPSVVRVYTVCNCGIVTLQGKAGYSLYV